MQELLLSVDLTLSRSKYRVGTKLNLITGEHLQADLMMTLL